MNKIYNWTDKTSIDKLRTSISNNDIVITSTDTIMGFLGNITQKSFDKISKIKGKRENKPFLVIINSIDKLSKFVDSQVLKKTNIDNLLKQHWPGPLTVIFKAKKGLPDFLKSKENTIAIRCPQHEGLQKILQYFDGLFSTSANKANHPAPKNHENIDQEIIKQVKFILIEKNVDTKNKLYQTLPSTIIDVSSISISEADISDNSIKIVRKGAYSIEELEKTYGAKFKK